MSGHNKWSKIKHKKAATDIQKSKLFSKLAKLIKVEARLAHGDTAMPGLRAAIEKAREANMPKENIDRAIATAGGGSADEKVLYEAYGPGGCAILIEGLTDNKNRTSPEIKHIFSKHGFALSNPGSVTWAFRKTEEGWEPQTTVILSSEDSEKLEALLDAIDDHDDVQELYTNAS